MHKSQFLLLLFLLFAAFASKNFFIWPAVSGKTPIKLRHVLIGVGLLIFGFFFDHTLSSLSSQTPELTPILYSLFLAFAFLFYLFLLPLNITRVILFSGDKPLATIWQAILSSLRMWIILIPVTQLIGIILNKFLILIIPIQNLHVQEITTKIQNVSFLTGKHMSFLLAIGVLTPFFEEVFFRGFLQTFLKNKLSRGWALFYTSIIFALSHVESSLGSLVFVPMIFVFSLFAGFLYEKERQILAPIVLHMLFNLTTFFFMEVT
ncbi:CPBP family intramembrane glutamic endopeptidase [Candidatus Chlamydia sanziniae]|uniref:CAAX prenyl protease 2/Lysostaphin resistance protein A-like domain-containing protein n=1 Tax=Candidatus Chlamydia sanziniae TaxID=1806891 RepID=A0A1A9HYH1_9CHLA|nr:type II CAAX endopeptidase family protein [Candidatus Chlamydia sanziniae]ANH79133.1 hypothetical protein Cs308_0963 [Candidatus Chlamydia sanziniae]